MRTSLADKIERYIKLLIERSDQGQIEIQRSELAETFCCVPSQVTYVIGTRFTEQEGYFTESRRGGKGFVRITRSQFLMNQGDSLSREQIEAFVKELREQGSIGHKEHEMLTYLVDFTCEGWPIEQRGRLLQALKEALSLYTSEK